jgi:hypothetical protein
MATNSTDILTYGDNATRGPLYNKSVADLGATAYVLVLPINPNRKFLLIHPHQHPVNVHFLAPGANPNTIIDENSMHVDDKLSSEAFVFDTFVPTNAVYMKSTNGDIDVTIYES